ncbi:tetratricopeptide repeat protein [Streptomyces griseochromogenes]|uniref:tetratricopeptide repeat protein n=1 Tax=Streptomyces griseochromogenes TaxID=68214 RepID=UPI003557E3C9
METTLAQREQVLGDRHPDTLTSRNNLATAYESAGNPERAVPLLETNLALCEQVLGDTHPHALASRNNLAHARRAAEAVQQRSTETSTTEADPQQPSRTD